ncbi:hypothetical protein [Nostoc sp. CALU 1950]|uniref:hypothetical protein n=1 Tax=Nostoc sp. CALU 1950 TaxID=3104321 RepID=UPI003EBB629C
MSNDNNNKVNFWTTVPGILTAIAALLTAVGTVVTAWKGIESSPKTSSAASPSEIQKTPTTENNILILKSGNDKNDGIFNVPANSQQGFPVKNSGNRRLKIDLNARGKWQYAPSAGLNSPEGHSIQQDETYRLPSAPQGSLIIRREENTYEYIGKQKEIFLEPQETVFLTINDKRDENSYLDNEGEIKVSWSCDDCTKQDN